MLREVDLLAILNTSSSGELVLILLKIYIAEQQTRNLAREILTNLKGVQVWCTRASVWSIWCGSEFFFLFFAHNSCACRSFLVQCQKPVGVLKPEIRPKTYFFLGNGGNGCYRIRCFLKKGRSMVQFSRAGVK